MTDILEVNDVVRWKYDYNNTLSKYAGVVLLVEKEQVTIRWDFEALGHPASTRYYSQTYPLNLSQLVKERKNMRIENLTEGTPVRIIKEWSPEYAPDDEDLDGKVGTFVRYLANDDYPYLVRVSDLPVFVRVHEIELVIDSDSETKENNVTDTFAFELERRVIETKAQLSEANEKIARLTANVDANIRLARDKGTELDNFRKQVAELAIETYDNGDGPWCTSGFENAMSDLGLEEFVNKSYSITVTLTIPSDSVPEGLKADSLSDGDIAAILTEATQPDVYVWVDSFETEED